MSKYLCTFGIEQAHEALGNEQNLFGVEQISGGESLVVAPQVLG